MPCYAPVRIAALFATGLMVSSLPSGAARGQTADDEYMRGSMATAFHYDASAVWGTAGHPTQEAAEPRVMDACNAAMGGGCVKGEGWRGEARIAVAMDALGNPWIKGGGYTEAEAESAALEYCEAENAEGWGPCRFAFSFSNPIIKRGVDGTRDYFPDGPVERHRWYLQAWPDAPSRDWANTSWISSGRRNFVEARDELLARCAADSGGPCTVKMQSPSGVFAHYVNRRGQSGWVGALTASQVTAKVQQVCPADERPCRVLTLYDAAVDEGLQVVRDPPLTRGFASVAWTTVEGWKRLAIVTGRDTLEAANADALSLCALQSQLPCALYLDHPDARNASFMALYSLSGDRLHMLFANSVEEMNTRAAEASQQNGTPYTRRALVDLHDRGEITPEY